MATIGLVGPLACESPPAAEVVHRVDAGGPGVEGGWAVDSAAEPSPLVNAAGTGNVTGSTGAAISTSSPTIPPGTPASVFSTWRGDPAGGPELNLSLPVEPGAYEVRLYFAETDTGIQAGQRAFDISVEGRLVLDDYDVAAHVGVNAGVMRSFTVATDDGAIDVVLGHVRLDPRLSAVEVVTAPAPPPPPPPSPGRVLARVNAGGGARGSAPPWETDTVAAPYRYVNAGDSGNRVASTRVAVALDHPSVVPGTPPGLFTDARGDAAGGANLRYLFAVPAGRHEVRLSFAETDPAAQRAGARKVDVVIEGRTVLDDWDTFAAVGGYRAVVQRKVVTSDGILEVVFKAVAGTPSITALEVVDLDAPAGAWSPLAPLLQPTRDEATYVAAAGRFVLAGGAAGGGAHGALDLVEAYDPITGTWLRRSPLPLGVHHVQGVELDGRIYYVGGLTMFPGDPVRSLVIYDPITDTFSNGAPMPTARSRGAGGVAVYDGRIYYVGGIHDPRTGQAESWLDVYDPGTNGWATLPDMANRRDHLQAAVVGGRLYAIGGRNFDVGAVTAANEAYDFATGRWISDLARLPTARAGYGVAVVDDAVVTAGGEARPTVDGTSARGVAYDVVEAYDTVANTWRRLPSLSTTRHAMGALACGGAVYVAGGGRTQGDSQTQDVHERLQVGPETPCPALPVQPLPQPATMAR